MSEAPAMTYRLDDPFSWLIAAGIAIILAAVLADWFILDRSARTARIPQ